MKSSFFKYAAPLALGGSLLGGTALSAGTTASPVAATAPTAAPAANAESTRVGLMINLNTGALVGGDNGSLNPDLRFNEASMTKIMTLLIALQKIESGELKPDEILNIPHPRLESVSGDTQQGDALLNEGNWIDGEPQKAILRADIENIYKAIVVSSSNIGCIALANRISGNETEFVALMNDVARQMGLENTHFMNSHGFPSPGQVDDHYSSPRDLMKIMMALSEVSERLKVQYPDMFEGLTSDKVDLEGYNRDGLFRYQTPTHSKLMRSGSEFYTPGISFIKTGYSKNSKWGAILISQVTSGDQTYNIGYVAGGFETQDEREAWIQKKLGQTPFLIAQDQERAREAQLARMEDSQSETSTAPSIAG